jgi:competence protein ComEC
MLLIVCFMSLTYYLFLKIELKKLSYQHVLIYLLFLGSWSIIGSLSFEDQVYFLAVRNGDSSVIKESFNRCTVVIDTGEGTIKEVTTFLKSIGVRTIHYLFLTHGDLDHIGEAESLINHFNVLAIVTNQYDYSKGMQAVINLSKNIEIIRAKPRDEFHCGKTKFVVLGPLRDYADTNHNSLVLYVEVFGKTVFFTGDIGSMVEKELITYYKHLSFDILKVAHHGSITSTSIEFLSAVSFREAVIMTGVNNRFGFPNPLIIDRLHPYQVYRTDLHHTITYKKYWYENQLKDPFISFLY